MKVKIKRVRGGSMGDQRNYGLVTGSIWNYEDKKSTNNVGTTLSPVPRDEATIEAERGETVIGDLDNDGMVEHAKIGGKRHSQGGTPLNVPDGSFVFSDYSKLRIKNEDLLKGIFNMSSKKAVTPAKVAQRYELNKYKQILNDPESDPMDKKTAQLMIDNNMKKLGQLALIQEGMKGFPDGIPAIAMPLLQGVPQSGGGQQQMMRKGGVVKYRKGGLARYQGLDKSQVSGANDMRQIPINLQAPDQDPIYGPYRIPEIPVYPVPDWMQDIDGDGEITGADTELYYQQQKALDEFKAKRAQELFGDANASAPLNDEYLSASLRNAPGANYQPELTASDYAEDPARNYLGMNGKYADVFNTVYNMFPYTAPISLTAAGYNSFIRPSLFGEDEDQYESSLTTDYINRKLAENKSLLNQPTSYTSDGINYTTDNPRMMSMPLYSSTPRDVDGYKWPIIGGTAAMAAGLPKNYNPYYWGYKAVKGAWDYGPGAAINEIIDVFPGIKTAGKKLLEGATWAIRPRTWSDSKLQPLVPKQPFWDKIRRKPFTPEPLIGPLRYIEQSPAKRFLGSRAAKLGIAGAALGLGADWFSDDIVDAYHRLVGSYDQVDHGPSGESVDQSTNGGNSVTTTLDGVTPINMDELDITNNYQDSISKSLQNNGVKDTTKSNQGSTNQGSTVQKPTTNLSDDEKIDKYLGAIGYSKQRIDTMNWNDKVYLYNRGKKPQDQIKKLGGESNLVAYKKKGQVDNTNRHDPDLFKYATQNAINAAKAKGYDLTYPPYSNVYGDAAGSQVNDTDLGEVYVNTPNSFWIGGSDDPQDMDSKITTWYKDHPALKDQWKNYPGGYDGWIDDIQLLSKYRDESSDWPEAYEKWAKNEGRQDPDEWLADTYDNSYYKPMTGEYYFNGKERDANGKLTVKGKLKGRKVQSLPMFSTLAKTNNKKKDDDVTTSGSPTPPNPQFQPSRYYGLGEPFPGELAAYQAALGQRIPTYDIADYDLYPSLLPYLYKDPNLEFLNQVTQNVQGEGTGPAARYSSTGVAGKALDAATKLIAQNRALNDDIYLKSAGTNAGIINETNKVNLAGDMDYVDKANAYEEALYKDLNKKDASIAKTIGPLHKSMIWQAATEAMNPNVDVSPRGYRVRGTAPNIAYSPTGTSSNYQAIWDSAYARFSQMSGVSSKEAAKMATEYARGAMTKSKAGTGDIAYSPYDVSNDD